MDQLRKKAITCFHNQRRRCYTKSNPRYKDNGAKGVSVEYTKDQFIDWFIKNYTEFGGSKPSVGRIDHSKSYSLDNIRFESIADNSLERINRIGPTKPRRKVLIIDHSSGYPDPVFIADSCREAARLTGIQDAHVAKYCNGTLKKSANNFSLRYFDC